MAQVRIAFLIYISRWLCVFCCMIEKLMQTMKREMVDLHVSPSIRKRNVIIFFK